MMQYKYYRITFSIKYLVFIGRENNELSGPILGHIWKKTFAIRCTYIYIRPTYKYYYNLEL